MSAITLMSTEGPNSVNNHYAESGRQILDTIGDCLCHFGQTAWYYRSGGFVVVLPPDHMSLICEEFSREQALEYLYETARRQTDLLIEIGRIAKKPLEYAQVEPGTMRSPLRSPEQLTFIECGGDGGRFSAVIPRWAGSTHTICKAIL
jgi:hypothetical protein